MFRERCELGTRPVPGVCTECHGAQQPYTRGLVVDGGRFLPANPFAVTHLQGSDIQQRLAAAYCAAVHTDRLTVPQQNYIAATYPDVCATNTEPKNEAPLEWQSSAAMADLWKQAVATSGATCHLALDTEVLGNATSAYLYEGMMPHSYPTWLRSRGQMGGATQIHGFDRQGNPAVYADALEYMMAWSGANCGDDDDQGENQP